MVLTFSKSPPPLYSLSPLHTTTTTTRHLSLHLKNPAPPIECWRAFQLSSFFLIIYFILCFFYRVQLVSLALSAPGSFAASSRVFLFHSTSFCCSVAPPPPPPPPPSYSSTSTSKLTEKLQISFSFLSLHFLQGRVLQKRGSPSNVHFEVYQNPHNSPWFVKPTTPP